MKDETEVTEQTKSCRNERCSMFDMLLDTNRKRCGMCASKLRHYDYKRDELNARGHRPINLPAKPLLLNSAGTVAKPADDKEEHVFTSNCDISGCPIAPSAIVNVPWSLFLTWVFLAKSYDVEWIAYLKGTFDADKGEVTLLNEPDSMIFPNQKATGAHVDAETNSVVPGVIASIHSHVSMKAFFSQEDKDHFNHTCDMVVNDKGDVAAVVRRPLKCGSFSRVNARIMFHGDDKDVGAVAALKQKLIIDTTPQKGNTSTIIHSTSGKEYVRTQNGLQVLDKRHHAPATYQNRSDIGFVGSTAHIPEDLRNTDPFEGENIIDMRKEDAGWTGKL